jgi:hypothetical protein
VAGRPPKVDHLRIGFKNDTQSAWALVQSALRLSGINPNTDCPRLHTEHARRVVELAFLGMVASWEEFLEQVFVRYMAGAKTDTGFMPTLRIGKCAGIVHSYQVLAGDPDYDPNKHYAKFGDIKWVIASSKLYFDQGSPFAARLHAKLQPLQLAAKLRNRVAHASTKVRSDFKAAAQVHLGLDPGDPLSQGYRVGDLLVADAERLFGQIARDRHWNFFRAYHRMFRELAAGIVP